MTISPESFAMVCFLTLMQNGGGIEDKHPSYIAEKTIMLRMGLDAFGFLDIKNMRGVVSWHTIWKVELPEKIKKEMKLQNKAEQELDEKNVFKL